MSAIIVTNESYHRAGGSGGGGSKRRRGVRSVVLREHDQSGGQMKSLPLHPPRPADEMAPFLYVGRIPATPLLNGVSFPHSPMLGHFDRKLLWNINLDLKEKREPRSGPARTGLSRCRLLTQPSMSGLPGGILFSRTSSLSSLVARNRPPFRMHQTREPFSPVFRPPL